MKEVIIDALVDTLKIIPFLFVAFLIMEYIEHKFNKKGKDKIKEAGRLGPLFGSLLGAMPQCGFSTMATNLYATRIITVGTLISIYLSTSDEMLPILISEGASFGIIFKFLIIKVLIGMVCGFIIDFIMRKKHKNYNYEIKDFCEKEHCDCSHGIIKSSIKHTINITIFILIVNILLDTGMHFFGEEELSELFLKNSLFGPFVSSLVGLIPNCAASVVLTELYLGEAISFASCLAGLLTGSGVALAVLFKVNKNLKQNLKIVVTVYLIGALSGVIVEVISRLI